MVAQFGWRSLFAAWGVATVIAAIALGMPGLPRLFFPFDLAQAGPTAHRLTNPRHDPAAFDPPANRSDPLDNQTAVDEPHSGRR